MISAKKIEFSLVMPCFKCEKTIKRAIESIIDQDLDSWELICVVNGEWQERDKTIKIIKGYMKSHNNIQLLELNEGNACHARNVGVSVSTGKYISFFSSDFIMYPGALRKWSESLADGSDFIYSGYALINNGEPTGGYVPSREFDPYLLEVNNYIDGGFPMKREVWEKGPWDINCKSLNDWDFWLTAVKNGYKGKMILDTTYSAEVPKEGGLSYDSAKNWLERVGYIKKKHGIPERDLCVVSLGAQPHGIKMAKMLNADFQVAPQFKPNNYKAIYLIGFYIGNGDSAIAHTKVFEGFKGKQIIHWIGTDIMQLIQGGYKVCFNDYKGLLDEIQRRTNLTEFEQAQGEMRSMGIETEIVPLPVDENIEIMPLPKKFTVATYVPATPTAKLMYNLELVADIIKSCPDINFLTFGGGDLGLKTLNIKNVGWTDMKTVMEQSSMLMRLTAHDGLPITPIEFRLAGRDAMTTVQIPYVYFAGNGFITKEDYSKRKEAIIGMLRDIKKRQKKSGPMDLDKAVKYYKDLTSPDKYRKTIYGLINDDSKS